MFERTYVSPERGGAANHSTSPRPEKLSKRIANGAGLHIYYVIMPNQKADDRTRVSYLEDAEIEESLQELASKTHCSIAALIREATYKYVAAHKGASSVALTTRRKPRPIRAKNPKKSPSTP
jgi:hypothetical protein